MSVRHSTDNPAAKLPPDPTIYDQLVYEIASLECVLGTLERWELSDRPTGADCQIGSAELTLRRTIARLHDINVRVLFGRQEREVCHE